MSVPSTKTTAKSRRWKARITLLQNALRARESLNRAQEALDHITRILFEEEEEAAASGTPSERPASLRGGDGSNPSERPTIYHEALKGSAMVRLLVRRWEEANTEDKREIVRDLAKKCHETKTLTDEEFTEVQGLFQ